MATSMVSLESCVANFSQAPTHAPPALSATGIRSDLYSNFDNLLSHASAYGIQVQPTFFNYPPNTSDFPVANFFTDSNVSLAPRARRPRT